LVGVGVGVGVDVTSVAVFEFELLVELLEVLELFEVDEVDVPELLELLEADVEFVVADFVAVEVVLLVVVLFCVVAAAADCVAAGAEVVTSAELFEVAAEAPAIESPLSPNCGGVTDKTAPRPPTVPPAISNTRFMPNLVFLALPYPLMNSNYQ
jgi:hypothetical protein